MLSFFRNIKMPAPPEEMLKTHLSHFETSIDSEIISGAYEPRFKLHALGTSGGYFYVINGDQIAFRSPKSVNYPLLKLLSLPNSSSFFSICSKTMFENHASRINKPNPHNLDTLNSLKSSKIQNICTHWIIKPDRILSRTTQLEYDVVDVALSPVHPEFALFLTREGSIYGFSIEALNFTHLYLNIFEGKPVRSICWSTGYRFLVAHEVIEGLDIQKLELGTQINLNAKMVDSIENFTAAIDEKGVPNLVMYTGVVSSLNVPNGSNAIYTGMLNGSNWMSVLRSEKGDEIYENKNCKLVLKNEHVMTQPLINYEKPFERGQPKSVAFSTDYGRFVYLDGRFVDHFFYDVPDVEFALEDLDEIFVFVNNKDEKVIDELKKEKIKIDAEKKKRKEEEMKKKEAEEMKRKKEEEKRKKEEEKRKKKEEEIRKKEEEQKKKEEEQKKKEEEQKKKEEELKKRQDDDEKKKEEESKNKDNDDNESKSKEEDKKEKDNDEDEVKTKEENDKEEPQTNEKEESQSKEEKGESKSSKEEEKEETQSGEEKEEAKGSKEEEKEETKSSKDEEKNKSEPKKDEKSEDKDKEEDKHKKESKKGKDSSGEENKDDEEEKDEEPVSYIVYRFKHGILQNKFPLNSLQITRKPLGISQNKILFIEDKYNVCVYDIQKKQKVLLLKLDTLVNVRRSKRRFPDFILEDGTVMKCKGTDDGFELFEGDQKCPSNNIIDWRLFKDSMVYITKENRLVYKDSSKKIIKSDDEKLVAFEVVNYIGRSPKEGDEEYVIVVTSNRVIVLDFDEKEKKLRKARKVKYSNILNASFSKIGTLLLHTESEFLMLPLPDVSHSVIEKVPISKNGKAVLVHKLGAVLFEPNSVSFYIDGLQQTMIYDQNSPVIETPKVNGFLKLFGKKDDTIKDADDAFQYSRSSAVMSKISETQEVMQQLLVKANERGELLNEMEIKSNKLLTSAQKFHQLARELKNKPWFL